MATTQSIGVLSTWASRHLSPGPIFISMNAEGHGASENFVERVAEIPRALAPPPPCTLRVCSRLDAGGSIQADLPLAMKGSAPCRPDQGDPSTYLSSGGRLPRTRSLAALVLPPVTQSYQLHLDEIATKSSGRHAILLLGSSRLAWYARPLQVPNHVSLLRSLPRNPTHGQRRSGSSCGRLVVVTEFSILTTISSLTAAPPWNTALDLPWNHVQSPAAILWQPQSLHLRWVLAQFCRSSRSQYNLQPSPPAAPRTKIGPVKM